MRLHFLLGAARLDGLGEGVPCTLPAGGVPPLAAGV
jgi:hypothetical protein